MKMVHLQKLDKINILEQKFKNNDDDWGDKKSNGEPNKNDDWGDDKPKSEIVIDGDVDKMSSYPACVQFGKPTLKNSGICSINGINQLKGFYFFKNYRYQDYNGNLGTYECKDNRVKLYPIEKKDNTTPVKPGDTTKTEPVKPGDTVKSKKFNRTDITGQDITNGKVVQRYMSGDIVGQIQKLLIGASKNLNNPELANISKNGTPDNYFGNRTESAVKLYQKLKGLNNDGKVGPKTWYFLSEESSTTPSTSTETPTTPVAPNKPIESPIQNKPKESPEVTNDPSIPNYPTNTKKVEYDPNKRIDNFGNTYTLTNGEWIQDKKNLNESVQVIKIKNLIKKIL